MFAVTAGLFLSGAGLAPGFPVMLGLISERFESLSGTAFSIAFSIALTGNMLINYLVGIIVHKYGIRHLTTVCYAEIWSWRSFSFSSFNKINQNNQHHDVSKTMA